MKQMNLKVFLVALATLLFPLVCVAQTPPDAVFKVSGNVSGGGSFPSDWAPSSWSYSGTPATGTTSITGSVSSNSITITNEVDITGAAGASATAVAQHLR